jgi:hypothetical protein
MRLKLAKTSIEISGEDGSLAGRYVYADPYKPYLHPLLTPSGVPMSAFMPHDHKHHRALMYALRTPELNFWEERVTVPEERVGRQVHRELADVVEVGDTVGFTQQLAWCAVDDKVPVFIETRRLSCTGSSDGHGFAWTWSTRLEAQSDVTLRMSQWSSPRADGALVNYHGLGLRLPREFGDSMASLVVRLDGRETTIANAHGQTPTSIEYRGAADGYWPVRFGGVRFTQQQPNALFIMKDPFAYIALGPSNLAPRALARGETIEEHYAIDVFDAEPHGG